jgi:tellurite resistance protein TerA
MAEHEKTSIDSIAEANRSRAKFSGHDGALGAAGTVEASTDKASSSYLRNPGECVAVSPGEEGFTSINIGVDWDNIAVKKSGLIGKLFKKTLRVGIDLDLGCMYEMEDGTRGAIQAFGKKFGNYNASPFIALSGDERTGDAKGHDEVIKVNGAQWGKIKRMLIYVYIYKGASDWGSINPRLVIDVPGKEDLIVTLRNHNDALCLCAVGGIENVRGGIKLTNFTEYFPGHEEMDRAFGYGLQWAEGKK